MSEKDTLAQMDLIVFLLESTTLTPAQEENLLGAVGAGCGLAAVGRTPADVCSGSLALQMLAGGRCMAMFPEQEIEVEIVEDGHPVAQGVDGFTLTAEAPCFHVDPTNIVLATARLRAEGVPWAGDEPRPLAWVRRYGKGRVFLASFGGRIEDFEISPVMELTKRGLLWAAR